MDEDLAEVLTMAPRDIERAFAGLALADVRLAEAALALEVLLATFFVFALGLAADLGSALRD
ncbi:hypothetical protein [Niveibacterium sp. 24ML]|uniref:hypothetical protein n=1 Tax=Niveibacterium sp. 24ML TaxID=2985512 RepID=UPI002B4BF056|nr:hypothetical protein [Niveibacterium sp. 24ML]